MVKKREQTFEELQNERMAEIVHAECLAQEKYIKKNYKSHDEYYQLFFRYKSEREKGIISNTMFFSEFARNNMTDVLASPEVLYKELKNAKNK